MTIALKSVIILFTPHFNPFSVPPPKFILKQDLLKTFNNSLGKNPNLLYTAGNVLNALAPTYVFPALQSHSCMLSPGSVRFKIGYLEGGPES